MDKLKKIKVTVETFKLVLTVTLSKNYILHNYPGSTIEIKVSQNNTHSPLLHITHSKVLCSISFLLKPHHKPLY